jgi:membrane protease YdiL (CAAX protease family)
MQTSILVLLLTAIFALFSTRLQGGLGRAFDAVPATIWLVPVGLTAIFMGAAALAGAASGALTLAILAYTSLPVLMAWVQGPGRIARPSALDFLTMLVFWLPLEFTGWVAGLIPRAAWGFLHSVAYGVAILLGLILFTAFRRFDGMKVNFPRGWRDLGMAAVGFLLAAPVLIPLGVAIGFMPAFHASTAPVGKMVPAFFIICAATGLPEEILFRSMIQNLLMLRFGATTRTLVVSSLIFGIAHLDNGPHPPPNWRYFILATIAGFAYGKVFQRSSSVLSSTLLHGAVDWMKRYFF